MRSRVGVWWTRARGFGLPEDRRRLRGGDGVFFREDGVRRARPSTIAGDEKERGGGDARVGGSCMAKAARFLFGGDAAASTSPRSRVARATRRVLETSRVSSFTERKIGGGSASCALGGFVLGGRLAAARRRKLPRARSGDAPAEVARLRRRARGSSVDARVEDDRALGDVLHETKETAAYRRSVVAETIGTRRQARSPSRGDEAVAEVARSRLRDRRSRFARPRSATARPPCGGASIEDKRRAESDRIELLEVVDARRR